MTKDMSASGPGVAAPLWPVAPSSWPLGGAQGDTRLVIHAPKGRRRSTFTFVKPLSVPRFPHQVNVAFISSANASPEGAVNLVVWHTTCALCQTPDAPLPVAPGGFSCNTSRFDSSVKASFTSGLSWSPGSPNLIARTSGSEQSFMISKSSSEIVT